MFRQAFLFLFISFIHLGSIGQNNLKESSQNSLLTKLGQELEASQHLTTLANYPEAYDKIWNALKVADSINNPRIKYQAYKNLSLLYSIFYKKDQALAAIDSLFIYSKELTELKQPIEQSNLYYTAALTYRMNGEYKQAKKYLSTSERLLDSLNLPLDKQIYVLTEKAHLFTLTENFDESEKILLTIRKGISENHSYASIVFSMLGDLYNQKGNKELALDYYNRCLKIINNQNKRLGLQVALLEKTSKVNQHLGNYKLALQQMTQSKILGDSLFGSQSQRNQRLLEIKDTYRKSIIENNRIKKEQELQLVTAQKEKLNLQLIFSVLIFIIAMVTTFFGLRLIRKKHATEKKLAEEIANTELEIKKKELAVTALQLMEKDKLLEEIKKGLDIVKINSNDKSVEQIKSTIKVNAAKTWQEFETRFVQVNSSFYESLGHKHANLSRNELKLCALVKLNFSTKEMAELLGVSADSVNKARYRLRKKLGLQRDDNLVTYISSF